MPATTAPRRTTAARGEPARAPFLRLDPRLRSVPWRDLLPVGRDGIARELLLGAPWLAASLVAADRGWWPAAPVLSFFFFLVGIRQAHGGMHGTLGLPRAATDGVMFVLSGLLLGSMHAVQVTHMRHHARCLEEDDVEGFTARGGGLSAVLRGPLFAARLVIEGFRHGSRAQRRWIAAEVLLNAAVVAGVHAWGSVPALYHVGAMIIGHCLTGYFLVWIVHRDLDPRAQVARTMRGPWRLPFLAMGYHLEHHLFPAVPASRMEELAARIDRVAPELRRQRIF